MPRQTPESDASNETPRKDALIASLEHQSARSLRARKAQLERENALFVDVRRIRAEIESTEPQDEASRVRLFREAEAHIAEMQDADYRDFCFCELTYAALHVQDQARAEVFHAQIWNEKRQVEFLRYGLGAVDA